jgi:predicted nicotinamide N-methyase
MPKRSNSRVLALAWRAPAPAPVVRVMHPFSPLGERMTFDLPSISREALVAFWHAQLEREKCQGPQASFVNGVYAGFDSVSLSPWLSQLVRQGGRPLRQQCRRVNLSLLTSGSSSGIRPQRCAATAPAVVQSVVRGLRIPPLPSGERLQIELADGLIGGAVWPSAVALCTFLSKQLPWLRRTKPTVAELGAGTGAVGIFAAALGCQKVVLTDVGPRTTAGYGGTDRLLRLLRENACANRTLLGASDVDVAELDWGQTAHADAVRNQHAPGGFDVLIGSDVIYASSAHTPLARTVARLLRPKGVAFLAHGTRMRGGAHFASPGAGDVHMCAFREAARASGLALEVLEEVEVLEADEPYGGGASANADEPPVCGGRVRRPPPQSPCRHAVTIVRVELMDELRVEL